MATAPRLSESARAALPPDVKQAPYNRSTLGVGIAHLGAGAFMRAHTAVYCDDAIAARGGNWGIAGVSLRQRDVYNRLQPQDCLYIVGERDGTETILRLVGAIRSIDVAPENPQKVVRVLAHRDLRIITLTVTEKGYCLDPASGELDLNHAGIAHDLRNLDGPKTAIGFIVAALKQRQAINAPAVTIVSCDNLPGNGARLRAAVLRFARQLDPALADWIDRSIAFPSTMVDRIVPATTDKDIGDIAAKLGCRDEAFVKTEPFRQWIIEDKFAGERPAWEAGGARFVADVAPYETAKLRLLNGAHTALAYLGCLAGFEYIHEVMRERHFAAYANLMMTQEISPVTPQPEGMSHAQYIQELLQRFANSALEHRTWQIAMDGSQKLPQRLLNTARAQLRAGGPIAGIGLAVAAWMRYALGRDETGRAIDVSDPMSARFAAIAAESIAEPEDVVHRYLGLTEVFGKDLPADARFAGVVAGYFRELVETGAASTVWRFVAAGRN